MSSVSGYDIAASVLYGLLIPLLLVLFVVALATVRRRNDPVRLPFLWLKLSMPLFIISAILSTADEILVVVIQSLDGDVALALFAALSRTYDLSVFFSNLADNVILLCLVELGLSFLRVFGKDGVHQQIIRYSNIFVVAILFALAFAMEGVNEYLITKTDYGYNPDVDWTNDDNLFGAYYIIYWIFSLPIVILSAIVLYFSIRQKHLQSLAACFLAVSLLNLTRTTWDLAYAIQYDIGYDPYYTIIPQFVIILYPILYAWVTVILFTLVIVIGNKKNNGLWSQQQHFYDNGGQGQGTQTSKPIGAGSYLQPAQPEIVVGTSPPWRPELGPNYTNSAQQYHGIQYQQQPPIVQNQVPQAYHVAGA